MIPTAISTALGTQTDVRHGDAGQATAAKLELLQLMGELGRDPGTATVCSVMYRLPGKAGVQQTWVATYREMQAWLLYQIGPAMARYGLTVDDLSRPGCPLKVAYGRQMPGGNFVTQGNWPSAMRVLPAAVSVHAAAERDGDTSEIEDLELLFRR